MKLFKVSVFFSCIVLLSYTNIYPGDIYETRRENYEHKFQAIDTNKDGLISLDEIQAEQLGAFKSLDYDKNGILQGGELLIQIPLTNKVLIACVGNDFNGEVTKDTFSSRFTGFYKKMDKNKDSYISKDEYVDYYSEPGESNTSITKMKVDELLRPQKKVFAPSEPYDFVWPEFKAIDTDGDGVISISEVESVKNKKEEYIANHPDLDPLTKDDIRKGIVRAGMSKEEVKISRIGCRVDGAPKSCGKGGCIEIYSCKYTSLTFVDDKLVAVSEWQF